MVNMFSVLLVVDFVLFCDFLRVLYLSKKRKEQKEKFSKRNAIYCTFIGAIAFLIFGFLLYNEGNWIGFIGGSIILLLLFILIAIEEFELPPYYVKTKS